MAESLVMTNERPVIIELLETYKDFPCLWDNSHKFYKNRTAREQALEILLKVWQKAKSDATIEDIKKKIENMRATYGREWKKVQNSKYGNEPIYIPRLWYYDYLTFLNESTTPKTAAEESDDDEPPEKKIRNSGRIYITDLQKQEKASEAPDCFIVESDSSDSYVKSVGVQLKSMKKLQRCIAEKLISEVMFYGKLGLLTMDSTVNVNKSDTHLVVATAPSSSHLQIPTINSVQYESDSESSS